MTSHDTKLLETMYGRRLCLYGRAMSHAEVMRSKTLAFGSAPDFEQSVVGTAAYERRDHATVVRFLKRSGPRGKERDTAARVVLVSGGNGSEGWRIVAESDASPRDRDLTACENGSISDAQALTPPADRCDDALKRVLAGEPGIRSERAKLDKMFGTAHSWLLASGFDGSKDRPQWSEGMESNGEYRPILTVTVNLVDGSVEASAWNDTLVISEAARSAIAQACRGWVVDRP
jgi:hypothetical protein